MRFFIGGILALFCASNAWSIEPPTNAGIQDSEQLQRQATRTLQQDGLLRGALGILLDSTSQGIIITDVFVNMPAYSAGLCKGDILIGINERPVTSLLMATQATQNLSVEYVMVDLQRRDMRISRKVYVQDGRPQYIGSYRNGRTLSFAIHRFNRGSFNEFDHLTQHVSQSDLDTLILDLRSNSGGSRTEAQNIARLLSGSADRVEPSLKIIILQDAVAPSAVHALTDMLVQQQHAQVWGKANSSGLDNEASGSASRPPQLSQSTSPIEASPAQAPVHWSMADVRQIYPLPHASAESHPMFVKHQGMAPLVWGVNGSAYAAMQYVRSSL